MWLRERNPERAGELSFLPHRTQQGSPSWPTRQPGHKNNTYPAACNNHSFTQHRHFMIQKNAYTLQELLDCGHGKMFGPGNARLPLPNMLMMDRVVEISADGGEHGKGKIIAELDIKPDLWFFGCHFEGDPVMPGCLGLDAMWQLIGFFLGWKGNPGRGRALGAGEVKFFGQVLPTAKVVRYEIVMKRVIERKLVMGIGDASLSVDGREIYTAKDLRVGLFTSTDSF